MEPRYGDEETGAVLEAAASVGASIGPEVALRAAQAGPRSAAAAMRLLARDTPTPTNATRTTTTGPCDLSMRRTLYWFATHLRFILFRS